MFHRFDKETHRCVRCDRWQAGYAPKKEPVMPRDECQVCERQQAVSDGKMMHHGYKRPGWGCIVNDCHGVNHAPFPATDALEIYAASLVPWRTRLLRAVAGLPTVATLDYYRRDYNKPKDAPREKFVIARGAKADHRIPLPSFEDLAASEERQWKQQISWIEQDQRRVAARIAKGQALTKGTP